MALNGRYKTVFGHLHIKNEQGLLGEKAAQNMLKQKGYTIVETNWKIQHLEIDIIAEKEDVIVFAEVKARNSDYIRKPEEYVDEAKKRHMQVTANCYIKYHQIEKAPRFDVIGVLLNHDGTDIVEISHIEDAFQPRMRTVHAGYTGERRWHTKKYWKQRNGF